MISTVGHSLIGYLASPTDGTPPDDSTTTGKAQGRTGLAEASMQSALKRASGQVKTAQANHALDEGQKTLASDLRAALAQAGATLKGAVEFTVDSRGQLQVQGSDADKAAVQAALKADDGLATRITDQAQQAQTLSSTIQQSAAISQAATYATSSGGVLSLYASMMARNSGSGVVYSVTPDSSTLSYPGSLAADA